jgi:hypothetical protein
LSKTDHHHHTPHSFGMNVPNPENCGGDEKKKTPEIHNITKE